MKNLLKALAYLKNNPDKRVRYATLEGNYDITFSKPALDGSHKNISIIFDDII